MLLEEVVDGELNLTQRGDARASHNRDGQVPAGDIRSKAAPPPGEAAGGGESPDIGRIDFEQAEDVKVGLSNDLLLPRPSAWAADAPQVQEPNAKSGRGQHAAKYHRLEALGLPRAPPGSRTRRSGTPDRI